MVNRNALTAYLLHEMPEAKRLDFAEEWFTDDEANSQLVMVEAELLDAYVRGELSRQQRSRVERYLLSSPEQQRKLQFAAALHAILPFRRRHVPWAAICAAALLVILAGLAARVWLQNRELRREIASIQQNTRPLGGGTYSALLISGGLRGDSQQRTVNLPRQAQILRLDLELSEEERRDKLAATLSIAGRRVWQEEPLRIETKGHAFFATSWIPADVLASGNYTLMLQADGNPIAYYTFTIIR